MKPLLARDVFDAECGCSETPRRLWAFAWVKFIRMLDIVLIVVIISQVIIVSLVAFVSHETVVSLVAFISQSSSSISCSVCITN